MKRIKIYSIIAGALMMMPAVGAWAQQALRSAYFLEGYSYRHQLNPALAPERTYFSMPMLGNMNVGTQGNVGLDNFLYPTANGELTTFMNESVNGNEFLDGLSSKNRMHMDFDMSIFSMGFRAFGGFNTVDVSLRSGLRMNLPYELFEFMKMGQSSAYTQYAIEDLAVSTTNYAEIALGHSHRINDKWNVGAKVKFLVGLADAEATIDRMNLTLSDDVWSVQAEGELNAALKGLMLPTKAEAGVKYDTPEDADAIEWDEADYDSPGVSGFGVAFDLGATYKVTRDLELSAAVLDLGFIRWNNNIKAQTSGEQWTFDGFKNIAIDPEDPNDPNDIENQMEQIGDDLERLANFHKTEEEGSRTRMLGATLNVGAQYTLPAYRKLKFGFLSSTRLNGVYTWTEGRISANVAPLKCFDASVNYALSTFGSSLGWILNFHAKGFNLFVGSDHQFFKVTPQYVPVGKMNTNFSMGINFPLGKSKSL